MHVEALPLTKRMLFVDMLDVEHGIKRRAGKFSLPMVNQDSFWSELKNTDAVITQLYELTEILNTLDME